MLGGCWGAIPSDMGCAAQAGELSYAAAAMPGRVAKIEDVTRQLQQGSLKLRVRDPASERAMRRSGIMQAEPGPSKILNHVLFLGLNYSR